MTKIVKLSAVLEQNAERVEGQIPKHHVSLDLYRFLIRTAASLRACAMEAKILEEKYELLRCSNEREIQSPIRVDPPADPTPSTGATDPDDLHDDERS